MKYISVDIECDGPIPGKYSMISIGAKPVIKGAGEWELSSQTYYQTVAPISEEWDPKALAVSGYTREQTLGFLPADIAMLDFSGWLEKIGDSDRIQFVSDNPVFDGMFVFYYMHMFTGKNPFGFSGLSMTSLWKGMEGDMFASFKHLRKTHHNHNALDDATGNAEALVVMLNRLRTEKTQKAAKVA